MDAVAVLEEPLRRGRAIGVARVKRKELSNPYPPRKSGKANPKDY